MVLLVLGLASGCSASDERQWMKVNERYTVQEFRRDHAECTRDKTLDDECMRRKGWVDLSAGGDKIPEWQKSPTPGQQPGGFRR